MLVEMRLQWRMPTNLHEWQTAHRRVGEICLDQDGLHACLHDAHLVFEHLAGVDSERVDPPLLVAIVVRLCVNQIPLPHVAHLLTCRQVDLRLAGTPSGLRATMRQHAGTTATDLDALALAGIGERHAVDTPADPVQCGVPPGGSPAGDMAVSDVDSECELALRPPAVARGA